MTRENKLALVLGFGLMLFVGILVSDHFAARQAPPLATSIAARPDVGVPPLPPPGGESGAILLTGRDGVVRPLPSETEAPDGMALGNGSPQPDNASPVPDPQLPTQAHTPAVKTYTVRDGDTFAAIAKAEYGRRSLGEPLAKYNGIQPSRLKVGASIQLPALEVLDGTAVAAAVESPALPLPSTEYRMYRVRAGDNLYRIAERELGAASRWQELRTCNDDVLKGSDQLTPGIQLKIPVEGRNSSV